MNTCADIPDARQVELPAEALGRISGGTDQAPYLHAPGSQDDVKAATHWVVADVTDAVRRSPILETSAGHLS